MRMMHIDDHEISISEPAEYEAIVLLDSESSDGESDHEPEGESIAYWRAERLAREEFIEVCVNLYLYVCWSCETGQQIVTG